MLFRSAILLAAGVTIGSVVSAVTKALKAIGKAMSSGLKDIGAKLGSLLPGLIGQVAHFLFNTAAKAVGFLAEYTWLLVLPVVAFVFEKYMKGGVNAMQKQVKPRLLPRQ